MDCLSTAVLCSWQCAVRLNIVDVSDLNKIFGKLDSEFLLSRRYFYCFRFCIVKRHVINENIMVVLGGFLPLT